MTDWSKKTPTVEGWYWIRYRSKNGTTQCPASLALLGDSALLTSARGPCWAEGPNHGGPGLKTWISDTEFGVDKTLLIGPLIKPPE